VNATVVCCFALRSPRKPVFERLLADLRYVIEPTTLTVQGRGGRRRFNERAFSAALADDSVEALRVIGRTGEVAYSAFRTNGFWQALVKLDGWPREFAWLDNVSALDGFTAAVVGDAVDATNESETFASQYRTTGRPLANERVYLDEHGRERVDVSGHYGRRKVGPGMWYWAGSFMRFGPPAFAILDVGKLLSFGDEVVRHDNGLIDVRLFEPDWPKDRIRQRQRAFRDHMNFDVLEERQYDEFAASIDPRIEMVPGSYSGGAVMRMTEWLDSNAEPVSKSSGRLQRDTFLDSSGAVVAQTTKALPS
jgi:hypothetical protein